MSIEIHCPVCRDLLKQDGIQKKGYAVFYSPYAKGEKLFVCFACFNQFKQQNPLWAIIPQSLKK